MLAINFTDQEKDQLKNIRIGAFITFTGIILRFIVGDIIKPLELFDIIHPPGHGEHHYEFHTPSFPDMCGDVVTIIIFAAAYLFMTSSSAKNILEGMIYSYCGADDKSRQSIKRVRDYILWTRNIFYVAIFGFGLYFFSKYILTIGLEVFSPEESESNGTILTLHLLNYIVKLTAAMAFVYAYCKYLCVHKHIRSCFTCSFSQETSF
ncbi:MAG: hypothetical protein ACK41Q_08790 [Candidatus Brocadia sp.]